MDKSPRCFRCENKHSCCACNKKCTSCDSPDTVWLFKIITFVKKTRGRFRRMFASCNKCREYVQSIYTYLDVIDEFIWYRDANGEWKCGVETWNISFYTKCESCKFGVLYVNVCFCPKCQLCYCKRCFENDHDLHSKPCISCGCYVVSEELCSKCVFVGCKHCIGEHFGQVHKKW